MLTKSAPIGQFARAPGSEARLFAKKGSGNRSLLSLTTGLHEPQGLPCDVRALPGQSLERVEGLLGKAAVEFADLLRIRHRSLVSPLDEFGLDLIALSSERTPVSCSTNDLVSSNDFRV